MNNDLKKTRRDNIIFLVKKYGSQKILGNKIGIHSSYIGHIISGKRNLGDDYCRKLENILGLPNNWLDSTH